MTSRATARSGRRSTRSEAGFEQVFEHALDGLLLIDPVRGEIVRANRAAEQALGYPPARLTGRHVSGLFPSASWASLRGMVGAVPADGVQLGEQSVQLADGSVRRMDVSVALTPWDGGEMLVATLRDASPRMASEEALRRSDERLELVLHGADLGLWDWNIETGEITFNARAAEIVGYAPDDLTPLARSWQSIVHEQDQDQVLAQMQAYLRGQTPQYESQHRLRHKSGKWVWVLNRGRVVSRAPDGRPLRATGTQFDISDRKRSEEERQALLDMAKALSGMLDLPEMVGSVERRTAEVLPADIVATIYWDPRCEAYRMISAVGVPPELAAALEQETYTFADYFGGALARGETVVVDLHEPCAPRERELLARFQMRGLAAVPLTIRGQIRGALCVGHRTSAFSASQIHFLDGIAQQLAVAVETATLHRAQQMEIQYSTALARVSRELISSLATPEVYERLCGAVTEVLECEVSTTFLWNGREQAYAAVASHGDSPERWEELRLVRLTAPMVAGLVTRLGATGLVRLEDLPAGDPVRRGVSAGYDLSAAIVVALRRSDELIGFLCAGYRGGRGQFSAQQEHIARGIAQVASLAIENARLVEELERANRVKSDFVATMSHELRTPLNVVIGYHDLLLEGEFGPLTGAQADRLRRADHSARELLDLINATLDLSRLESRQVPVALEQVDLRAMIDAVVLELGTLREKSGVRFDWRVPASLPPIHTDPLKLKVVLKNLLHNAFKFTEAGAVAVRVGSAPERVQFEVADTGVGIAPELIDAIFEPFRQADSSSTRSYGGVGLGLFIVRRLLELLGGGIEVESAVGSGSRFRFWIPMRP